MSYSRYEPDVDAPAAADPRVQGWLRTQRRIATALVPVFLALFVGGVVVLGNARAGDRELTERGIRTPGVVMGKGYSQKQDRASYVIHFRAGGVLRQIALTGGGRSTYAIGDRPEVIVDPADPYNARTDELGSKATKRSTAAAVLLLGSGGVAALTAVAVLASAVRIRRVVGRARWARADVTDVLETTRWGVSAYEATYTTAAGTIRLRGGWTPKVGETRWIAMADRGVVVASNTFRSFHRAYGR